MLKKAFVGSLAVITASTFFFGRDALSYLTTGASSLREAVRSEVPIEFEMERAKHEVDELVPAIHRLLKIVARQQVEVENLRANIEQRTAAMNEQEEAILALNEDLKTGDSQFVYAGHSYTVNEVQRDLTERFNRFKTAEATLKDQQQLLADKERVLEAHANTLEDMLSQKKTLEVDLERLMARMQMIQARKQISSVSVDDSQLARAKSLINEIDKKLDIEAKLLDAEGNFLGLIPVETKSVESVDIALQVEAYFGSSSDVRSSDLDAIDAKIVSLDETE